MIRISRKIDLSKLKYKVISTEEALKDVEPWINDVKEYIEDINNGLISPQESLNSLIKAGICNNDGKLTEPYRIDNEEPQKRYCAVGKSLE